MILNEEEKERLFLNEEGGLIYCRVTRRHVIIRLVACYFLNEAWLLRYLNFLFLFCKNTVLIGIAYPLSVELNFETASIIHFV